MSIFIKWDRKDSNVANKYKATQCILQQQYSITMTQRMAKRKKTDKMRHSKDLDQGKVLHIFGSRENWYIHFVKRLASSTKDEQAQLLPLKQPHT